MQFKAFHRILLLAVSVLLGTAWVSPATARNDSGPRDGFPGRRVSGGSRQPLEACVANAAPLVALMPESNLAMTTDSASTLWFHLPEVAPSRQLEFKLYDDSNQLYKTQLAVPQSAGLVGIDLAHLMRTADAPALEVGNVYRWTFAIVCDPENRAEDHWVQGWIEPTEAPASPAENWLLSMDAFAQLAQSSLQSGELVDQWQNLVSTAGLAQVIPEQLSRAPIVLQPAQPASTITLSIESPSPVQ